MIELTGKQHEDVKTLCDEIERLRECIHHIVKYPDHPRELAIYCNDTLSINEVIRIPKVEMNLATITKGKYEDETVNILLELKGGRCVVELASGDVKLVNISNLRKWVNVESVTVPVGSVITVDSPSIRLSPSPFHQTVYNVFIERVMRDLSEASGLTSPTSGYDEWLDRVTRAGKTDSDENTTGREVCRMLNKLTYTLEPLCKIPPSDDETDLINAVGGVTSDMPSSADLCEELSKSNEEEPVNLPKPRPAPVYKGFASSFIDRCCKAEPACVVEEDGKRYVISDAVTISTDNGRIRVVFTNGDTETCVQERDHFRDGNKFVLHGLEIRTRIELSSN